MKAPKLFKTEIGERRFDKNILGRIHVESERAFVLQLYGKGPEGRYRRPPELSEEQIGRLKQLAGSIRKNRGVVRTGKVSLLTILAAALLVFNFAFKNRIAGRSLERALEAVFEARSEVADLDLRILAGRLSFGHLSVADRDQPMQNLFELGPTVMDLNTNALLKGRVVVSNLESREIRWLTPRQTSGALPGDEEEEERSAREGGIIRRLSALDLGALDARALLDEQLDRLDSPVQIAALNGRLEELQVRWQGTVEQGRADVDELAGRIESVRSIDVGSLDTIPELQQAVTDIQQAAGALDRVSRDLQDADSRIKEDQQEVAAARRAFRESVDSDLSYLTSLSDLSSGELRNLVSDLAAGYLERSLGRFYGYARRAWGYAGKLIARKGEKKEEKSERREGNRMDRGIDVPFAPAQYPRFLLENAGASVQDTSRTVQGSLRNVSSNPELVGSPLSFAFQRTEGQRRLAVDGELDLRTDRDRDLGLGVQAAGYTFELSEGLGDLGLSAFSAGYRFQTQLSRSRAGEAAAGQGLLELYDVVLTPAAEPNRLGTVLYETLGSMPSVDIAFDYTVEAGSLARVEAGSSADRQLARALEERFTEISAQYQGRLRDELNARMAAELEDNEALSRAFGELVQGSSGNLAEAAAYEAVLAEKRAEVERRIADTQKQATDAVRSQLESQLEKLPLPRLGF
ncbi:MAG: hypothetical protein JXB06_14835 [Spirochaetales bacterium]|nr:hypothetical protein [Spirochaetales bacterium]